MSIQRYYTEGDGPWTAHREHWEQHNNTSIYQYDITDDGPEAEAITRILASHPWVMRITDIRTPMVVESRRQFFPKGD